MGGDSLVNIRNDATMSASSCAGENGGVLHLASGTILRGYTSLFDGRGGSDR